MLSQRFAGPVRAGLLTALLILSGASAALAQDATAEGTVFHDRNGNEQLDPDESGIADVAVSNGEQVTLTDEEGHWELPAPAPTIFFVVKPRDWMTPVNRHHLPRFYYIHKPEGSPGDLKYRGVEPTGPLPEQINFPLHPEKTGDRFKAVLFGDPQPYTIQQIDYVAQDIVQELIGVEGLEFGMTMGDIVGDSLALFQPMNEAVGEIGIPWYNVPGNHDVNYNVPRDELSDETFERVYGPATYAFEYGDAHFIVLDDVIYPREPGGDSYVGGLRPDQLTFVENYLEVVPEDELVVLTMHIPLEEHGDGFRDSDQARLFELLQDHEHTLSISAHTHVQEHKFFEEGSSGWQRPVPHHHYNMGTTSGSWWNGIKGETGIPHTMMRDGTPNGYSYLRIDGKEHVLAWKVAAHPADYRMNIHPPDEIVAGSSEEPMLTVNAFNASEKATVEYRLRKSAPWEPMEKVEKVDPFYADLHERSQILEKMGLFEELNASYENADQNLLGGTTGGPEPSTHLWEAPLGTDWAPGRHRVEVKVTDMFGRTYTDVHTFRVVE